MNWSESYMNTEKARIVGIHVVTSNSFAGANEFSRPRLADSPKNKFQLRRAEIFLGPARTTRPAGRVPRARLRVPVGNPVNTKKPETCSGFWFS